MTNVLPDPVGYRIEYRGKKLSLIRLIDSSEVGLYPTREAAIEAAFADGQIPGAMSDGA